MIHHGWTSLCIANWAAPCGIENSDSVDADRGLPFAETIKFCFRDGAAAAVDRGSTAAVVKNDLLGSNGSAAYLPEENRQDWRP
jgi:hypothetical protein